MRVLTAFLMAEAHRVLVLGGRLVIGFIDRDSALGQHYLAHRCESIFYRDATFYAAAAVDELLRSARFPFAVGDRTLFGASPDIQEIEPLRPGIRRGTFVVVSAETQP